MTDIDMDGWADLGTDILGFQNHAPAKRTAGIGWDPDAVGPNTRTTLMDAWERTKPEPKPIHPLVWAFLTVSAFLSIWAVIFTGNHLTHIHQVAVQTQDAYLTCYDAQGQEIPRSAGNAPFKECKRSHVL